MNKNFYKKLHLQSVILTIYEQMISLRIKYEIENNFYLKIKYEQSY